MSIYSMLIVLFSNYCFVCLKPFDDDFDDHMIKRYDNRAELRKKFKDYLDRFSIRNYIEITYKSFY